MGVLHSMQYKCGNNYQPRLFAQIDRSRGINSLASKIARPRAIGLLLARKIYRTKVNMK